MKELIRSNLFLADSDSVNFNYNEDDYKKKFKSALLMAKSVGLNPNMIIDSRGFESITKDETIRKFFINKILELNEQGIDYSINVHVFGDYLQNDYFENYSKENPFEVYFNEKIENNYLFSSYNCTKKELLGDTIKKSIYSQRLEDLDKFRRDIYKKTGKNIFSINKSEKQNLRDLIISRLVYVIKNINSNTEYIENEKYFHLIKIFNNLIKDNENVNNRSDFYKLLNNKELLDYDTNMLNTLKIDIIDICYNSSFIKKNETFRFKNLSTLDTVYSKIFDAYSNNTASYKAYRLYEEFKSIQSKFEIIDLALSMNPLKLIDFFSDKIFEKIEDEKITTLHRLSSYIIPKTRLLGISNSKNLLIGVKS